ncbi:MAG TPA: MotA/TolQ/ExbB proton channel family protein [Firmicutes bacterium]|nr:MotA/TolQ/ExbB proton channel family protein [Bacillota bacterium]
MLYGEGGQVASPAGRICDDFDMVDILIMGGPVMVPLALCSILALAIAIEKIYYLMRTRSDPERALRAVGLALEHGRIGDAIAAVEQFRGQLGALMTAGLMMYGKDPKQVENAIRAAGEREIYLMERGLPVLGMIVTISPLLGILGTVLGIIDAFQVLSSQAHLLEPAALSAGIAEALITTAAGLIIAVPALALHTWISGMVERRVREMGDFATELINLLTTEVRQVAVSAK